MLIIAIVFSLDFNCFFLDKHHVDDENEAVEFIEREISNSHAVLMEVHADEVETDSTPLKGSSKAHEYRYSVNWNSISNL